MEDCLFCQIVGGEVPANFVYQDEDIVAFTDIHPQAPIHDLIVPRKHLKSLSEAEIEDQMLLGKILLVAKTVATKEHVTDSGYRLVINNGGDAGQIIDHLHFHLLAGKKMETREEVR